MSGFTKHPSIKVTPPGVDEAPIIIECVLQEHIQFSTLPAGGNLLLGKIVYIHAKKEIFNDEGFIDPIKIDQIGRLGGNWYTRANQGLFELATPKYTPVGFVAIPDFIKSNSLFTNELLCRLAYAESVPEITTDDFNPYKDKSDKELLELCIDNLSKNNIVSSWKIIKVIDRRNDD